MPSTSGGEIAEPGNTKRVRAGSVMSFGAMFNVQRLLGRDGIVALADRMAPGGSGDPFDGLDTHAREELGIDPDELGGSPWVAAGASFALFVVGAIVPILPFVFLSGTTAVVVAVSVSALGLFGIGAAITLLTGRSVLLSGFRQLAFGAAAFAVTYGIGALFGTAIG